MISRRGNGNFKKVRITQYGGSRHKASARVTMNAYTIDVNVGIAIGELLYCCFFISKTVVSQVAIAKSMVPLTAARVAATITNGNYDKTKLCQPVYSIHSSAKSFVYSLCLRTGIDVLDDRVFFGRVEIERLIHYAIQVSYTI